MRILVLIIGLCLANVARAQIRSYEVGFKSENDSFLAGGSDRYYTNGLFLFLRHGLRIKPSDTALLKNKVLGFEFGQKIFNPVSGSIPSRRFVDRPFAGYLYAGSSLNILYHNESNLKFSAQLGIVGPGALGEQAQYLIHNTFGFYALNGWTYQVQNNFQLNLGAEYNRLLARASTADVSLSTYGRLGTGFSGIGTGALIRVGNFMQLFNSVSTQSTAIERRNFMPLQKKEFFVYLKPMLNYVAYDATITGGLFANNKDNNSMEITLSSRPIVITQQVGLAYAGSRWVFDLSATFTSKDVKESTRSQQWGSVTVLYRFH
jgi:lipid A 3-O-deacylase